MGSITSDASGNIWFTGNDAIWEMSPSGSFNEHALPVDQFTFGGSGSIAKGSNGNIWFTTWGFASANQENQGVAEITPAGTITQFQLLTYAQPPSLTSASAGISKITSGPDGNIWLGSYSTAPGSVGSNIIRVTPGGVVTKFPILSGDAPANFTAGSDGNIWFTEMVPGATTLCAGKVGKVTMAGVVTEYPVSASDCPISITGGYDGNVWFTNFNSGTDSVSRITPSGTLTDFSSNGNPLDIAQGSGGNLWFTDDISNSPTVQPNKIGQISSSGAVTDLPMPIGYSPLWGGMTYADDALWFVAGTSSGVYIMRYGSSSASPPSPSPSPALQDTGFRPSKDGFGFHNYDPNSPYDSKYYKDLSLASFEQFFGKQNVLANNGQLRWPVNLFYDKYSTQYVPLTTDSDYKHSTEIGRCFGFSGASLMNFLHLNQGSAGSFALPAGNYSGASVVPTDVPSGGNSDLADTLGYYSGVDTGAEAQSALTQSTSISSKNPSAILSQIEQSIQNGTPMQVAMYKTSGSTPEGHSLVAYSYQPTSTGVLVNVYDSNYPNDDNRQIDFDTQTNSWVYSAVDSTGVWDSFQNNGTLGLFPAADYTHQGVLPWNSNDLLSIIAQPTASLSISTTGGQVMGLQNGSLVAQIDNAAILPMLSDGTSGSSGLTYTLPINNPYTVDLSNTNGQDEPVDLYANGAVISVSGLTPSKGDTATLALGGDDKSVTVSSPAAVANYSITLDQETSTSSLTYTITGASLNPGEKTTFALLGGTGQLQIKNGGAAKTYSVTMQETGGTDSTMAFNNVGLGSNATDTWVPTNWDNLSGAPINLTVDKNSDGKSVSTTVANALTINNDDQYTNTRKVTLHFAPPAVATQMRISNDPFRKNDRHDPDWQKFSSSANWNLSGWNGKHTIYAQFKTASGTVTDVYTSSITLDNEKPQIYWVSINNNRPTTKTTAVQLRISARDRLSGIQSMQVSNSSDFSGAVWEPYASNLTWTLSPLTGTKPQLRWVYVRVKDGAGNVSWVFRSPVRLLPT